MSKAIRNSRKHNSNFSIFKILKATVYIVISVVICLFLYSTDWQLFVSDMYKVFDLRTKNLYIRGVSSNRMDELKKHLTIKSGMPILEISLAKQKKYLEENASWVKNVVVKRRLPNTIIIEIEERKPIAIWQYNKKYYTIDANGVILDRLDFQQTPLLPIVVGEEANIHAAEFINDMKTLKELVSRVSSAVFIGRRRWDVYFDKKIKVMLPEMKATHALKKLLELHKKLSILNLDINTIDMRIAGKYTISGHEARIILNHVISGNREI